MRPHPYLRAYMAGIVVPTAFLLVAMTILSFFSFYLEVPSQFVLALPAAPLERTMVFPMAVVPNLWGAWNMLHLALRGPLKLPLGLHGALLPIVLVPAGILLARALDAFSIQLEYALPIIPIGMALYYVIWRNVVSFLNRELGIA